MQIREPRSPPLQHRPCQKPRTPDASDSGRVAMWPSSCWQVYESHVPPASLHWASVCPKAELRSPVEQMKPATTADSNCAGGEQNGDSDGSEPEPEPSSPEPEPSSPEPEPEPSSPEPEPEPAPSLPNMSPDPLPDPEPSSPDPEPTSPEPEPITSAEHVSV